MNKRAVLIVHGFGGDEQEILYLHNYLKANKVTSFWLRLSGHDGSRKSLSKATYQEWLKEVKDKVTELGKTYDQITCIGYSMGGLLSIHASELQGVDQLILCSTPMYLYNPSVIVGNLMKGIFLRDREIVNRYFNSTTNTSIKACFQFLKLFYITRKMLEQELRIETSIKNRIMIMQNKDDETSHYRSAHFLWKQTGKKGEVHLYPKGDHLLFLSANKEQAVNDILCFILELKEKDDESHVLLTPEVPL